MQDAKCLVLGYSFVNRLSNDLERGFNTKAKQDFSIHRLTVRLFGRGGRTIKKLCQHDLSTVKYFGPDIVILELGTNDLSVYQPEVFGSGMEELVKEIKERFSVQVVGVCKVIPRSHECEKCNPVIYNKYINAVIKSIDGVFVWTHRGSFNPTEECY